MVLTCAIALGITAVVMFSVGLLAGRKLTLNEYRGSIGSKRSRGPLGID
jgi:hypothetical protein